MQVVRRVSRSGFVVKHTKNVQQAARAIRQLASSDCAIVSARLGAGNGFSTVLALRKTHSGLPILVLGSSDEPELVNRAFELQVGFLVTTPDLDHQLTAFLRRVASHQVYVEQARHIALETFATEVGLSIREAEVLAAAESGVPRGRIADTLGISENTVKTHVRSILRKTNHSSLSEVVWLVRNGHRRVAGSAVV